VRGVYHDLIDQRTDRQSGTGAFVWGRTSHVAYLERRVGAAQVPLRMLSTGAGCCVQDLDVVRHVLLVFHELGQWFVRVQRVGGNFGSAVTSGSLRG